MASTNPQFAYPWRPDRGDGSYANPILHADYSDPDVIRDGTDFWLTTSSFTNTPGLPILHSTDLVNWKIVNHALTNVPNQPGSTYDAMRPGCGVWAPAIRKHAGKFWIFFPTPDDGIYVTTAEHPTKPWSVPWLLLPGKGLIDPCPLWDDEGGGGGGGKAYLVHAYAKSRAGIKDLLRVRPMSPDARQILGDGQIVYSNPETHRTLEGPKFHKRNGFYYLSAPAGGVPTGYQLILRAKDPFGPYEEKIVLQQGDTPINGPHQGAIVDDNAGDSWFVHFQDLGVYGRIAHLQPVRWIDDWPIMGDNTHPVPDHRKPAGTSEPRIPATSDEFDADTLGLQWQFSANHRPDWATLTARKSHLRLIAPTLTDLPIPSTPSPSPSATLPVSQLTHPLGLLPTALGQKLPARAFTLEAPVELSPDGNLQAGLAVLGKSSAALMLDRIGTTFRIVLVIDDLEVETHPLDICAARLRLTLTPDPDTTPDAKGDDTATVRFEFATPTGDFKPLAKTFTAIKGQWIGARVALLARSRDAQTHYADFDSFRFSPPHR